MASLLEGGGLGACATHPRNPVESHKFSRKAAKPQRRPGRGCRQLVALVCSPYDLAMSQRPVQDSSLASRAVELVAAVERTVPDLVALYVFGSHANATAGLESDIDLGFLATTPMSAEARFELQEELAALLGADVDLVDLRQAPTVLQMQIVSKGRVLVERDARERVVFENFVFSSYARLNEERREILDQVFREGRIYGG